MAVLVSGAWVRLVCIFCVVLVPEVWADYCKSYWDVNNNYHELENCDKYCCGDCNKRYCCKNKNDHFTPEDQDTCPNRLPPGFSDTSMTLAIILGTVIPIVVILVCIIICCLAPCCLCYKVCRKQRNPGQTVVTDGAAYTPQPPYPQAGYQASHPGYRAVPGHDGSTLPTAPPPSYMESVAYPPSPLPPEQYPLTAPNQPYGPPLPTDAVAHSPFNPSFTPQP